jgi:propionyl-CoA synthetase
LICPILNTCFWLVSVWIPDTLTWAENCLKVPVIDHWWQTETGWAIAANCMGIYQFDIKPGSPDKGCTRLETGCPGYDGHPVALGKSAPSWPNCPLPPGTLPTLWQNDNAIQRKISE